ncbi:helix-turn-helix transcriptional regulator [Azospirillum sp.]|uniref:helix-turn-helix domain-containing protein n=1 Tax=Azospirillum sp. TaxID=34012 RepID=UPI002D2BC07D|nr:helix-turn-helix transcriptional regulator [Azospirillum sp.]HYD65560.1 helix-turn-helix transcriptional regulator [Azospirillum sp.]
MDVRRVVAHNLRRLRKAAGLSQEELAHRAGLDRTYVSGVERGVRNPTVLVLQDLAGVLAVRPADLLADVEEQQPDA